MPTWVFIVLLVTCAAVAALCVLMIVLFGKGVGKVLTALFATLLLATVAFGGWLTYDFLDDRDGHVACAKGVVSGKYVEPRRISMISNGKTAMPIAHPERPHVVFSIPGWTLDRDVGWDWYAALHPDVRVNLCYRSGRFSGEPRSITGIRILQAER